VYIQLTRIKTYKKEKGDLRHLECFHNGIILIVNCFRQQDSIFIMNNKKVVSKKRQPDESKSQQPIGLYNFIYNN